MNSRTKQLFSQFFLDTERAETIWVCQDCLSDSMLKKMGCVLLEERVCSACTNVKKSALTPKRIASFIRKELPKHFEPDSGLYPGYELKLDDVVGKAIGCDSEAVRRAIAACLEDANADEDDFYFQGQDYCCTASPFESEEHERW